MSIFKRLIMSICGWLIPPKTVDRDLLDEWSSWINIERQIWKEKPDLPEWRFKHEEVYSDPELTKLFYKYIETDESLKARIKESLQN